MSAFASAPSRHVGCPKPPTIQIPSTDILTFTFANLGQYDNNVPILLDARCPSNAISAAQARHMVRDFIATFKRQGLKKGDCVCLHTYNNIWYPLIWLAVIGSGAIISGTNPALTSDELVRHFRLTAPTFIITQVDCVKPVLVAATQCQIAAADVLLIDLGEKPAVGGSQDWWSVVDGHQVELEGPGGWCQNAGATGELDQERIAMYAMTSGTTGLPKAAMISHRSVVAQAAAIERAFNDNSSVQSQLVCLPVFHAFAAPLALILPFRLGLPTYFLPRFTRSGFLDAVHAHCITTTSIVPPIATMLNSLSPAECHVLDSLRYVICAGARLTAGVQNALYKGLHQDAVVAQCWGSTEAGWHTLFGPHEKDLSGSVGRLLPNVAMKVVSEDDIPVDADDHLGEALIRSPALFSGYLGNLEATRQAFDSAGFYRTGDRVHVSAGKVYVDARMKEIMKVKGWQVSPMEIEAVLLEHPQIADAAVLGIEREDASGDLITLPRAYVVRTTPVDGTNDGQAEMPLDEHTIQRFVEPRLISYKRLTGGVVFVKRIPRSPTGKILRYQLPEMEVESDSRWMLFEVLLTRLTFPLPTFSTQWVRLVIDGMRYFLPGRGGSGIAGMRPCSPSADESGVGGMRP